MLTYFTISWLLNIDMECCGMVPDKRLLLNSMPADAFSERYHQNNWLLWEYCLFEPFKQYSLEQLYH